MDLHMATPGPKWTTVPLQPCLTGLSFQGHNFDQRPGCPKPTSTQSPGQCLAMWPDMRDLERAGDRRPREVQGGGEQACMAACAQGLGIGLLVRTSSGAPCRELVMVTAPGLPVGSLPQSASGLLSGLVLRTQWAGRRAVHGTPPPRIAPPGG